MYWFPFFRLKNRGDLRPSASPGTVTHIPRPAMKRTFGERNPQGNGPFKTSPAVNSFGHPGTDGVERPRGRSW